MTFPHGHSEEITFHLYHSNWHPVVLGYPWFARHNQQFNWTSGAVIRWSDVCKGSCIPEVSASVCVATSTLKDDLDLSKIPQCYHDLEDIFSKSCSTSLPPHPTYDHIQLVTFTCSPYIYYIWFRYDSHTGIYLDIINNSIIRPSSSPAGTRFFFVKKKDGSLRPYIENRGLNEITVKNGYPLISTAFELLQNANFFFKVRPQKCIPPCQNKGGGEWKTAFNTPTVQAFMSIWACPLALPTLQPFSRHSIQVLN